VIAGSDSTRTQNRVNPRLTAALDGKTGRDQQQSKGGEVADINAVGRSERDQDLALWKGSTTTSPTAMAMAASMKAWNLRRRR
jgi:hypothetical protein